MRAKNDRTRRFRNEKFVNGKVGRCCSMRTDIWKRERDKAELGEGEKKGRKRGKERQT